MEDHCDHQLMVLHLRHHFLSSFGNKLEIKVAPLKKIFLIKNLNVAIRLKCDKFSIGNF